MDTMSRTQADRIHAHTANVVAGMRAREGARIGRA